MSSNTVSLLREAASIDDPADVRSWAAARLAEAPLRSAAAAGGEWRRTWAHICAVEHARRETHQQNTSHRFCPPRYVNSPHFTPLDTSAVEQLLKQAPNLNVDAALCRSGRRQSVIFYS